MALFVSGINEFCNLVKIQAELLSAASSSMDKSVSCRLAAVTSIGIAEIKLNDASTGLFPTTARAIAFHTRDDAGRAEPRPLHRLLLHGHRRQPRNGEKMVGRGSQYAWAARDAKGQPLDGGKNYRLHLPPNIPIKEYWSVILYSNQTRSMIQTDQQFPSVGSQTKGLLVNQDGSVDVYFGPTRPTRKEKNWVRTVPGKGWNVILRLYSPLEPWFDKTWRPSEIEKMN